MFSVIVIRNVEYYLRTNVILKNHSHTDSAIVSNLNSQLIAHLLAIKDYSKQRRLGLL